MAWLKRQTNFPGGISAGGGSTGWQPTPQPTLITLYAKVGFPATAKLPVGTIILDVAVLPHYTTPCTVGTLSLMDTTNSIAYIASAPAAVASKTPLVTIGAIPADTTFTLTATGTDGVAVAGLTVICQRMRP